MRSETGWTSSQTKGELEKAIKKYKHKSYPIRKRLSFLTIVFTSFLVVPDFWKAIVSLSPLKILQANELGGCALFILLILGSYYLIKYDFPLAFLTNTKEQIE